MQRNICVPFSGQVPKDATFPEAIEDIFDIAPGNSRLVISDGASESFDSRRWARILVEQCMRGSTIDANSISESSGVYKGEIDPSNLPWPQSDAYERGSFATVLCIDFCSELASILAIGDTTAVLLNSGDFVDAFPYRQSSDFDQRPELCSTKASLNEFLLADGFPATYCKTWQLEELGSPTILCMTDALAQWAFRCAEENHPMWGVLASIRELSELEELVFRERESKLMRIDDVTLVHCCFTENGDNGLSLS